MSEEGPKVSSEEGVEHAYIARPIRDRFVTLIPGVIWSNHKINQEANQTEENGPSLPKEAVATSLDVRLLELYALAQEYSMEPGNVSTATRSRQIDALADLNKTPDNKYLEELQTLFEQDVDENTAQPEGKTLGKIVSERRESLKVAMLNLLADSELRERYEAEVASEKAIHRSTTKKGLMGEVLEMRALQGRLQSARRRIRVDELLAREEVGGVSRPKAPGRTPMAVANLDRGITLAQAKEAKTISKLSAPERGLLATEALLKGKRELETSGFAMTPSRERLVTEIADLTAQGFRVFMGGPTGTGKTALAIFALKELADGSYSWITWTGETSVRDIFGSPKLTQTSEGKFESSMTKGPMTRAVIGEKRGVLNEEITAGQTNVQMSMKTIWSSRPGDQINLPGFNGTEFTKAQVIELATGNLKGKRHQERESMDPAIAREFKALEVPFIPAGEMRDIILMDIIDRSGVMPISKTEIGMIEQFCKAAEFSQMAYLEEIPSEIKQSDLYKIISPAGQDVALSSVFFDTGTVRDLFKGWRASGRPLAIYLQEGLHRFIDANPHFSELKVEREVLKNILRAYGFAVGSAKPENFFTPVGTHKLAGEHPYLRPSELGFLIPGAPPSEEDEFSADKLLDYEAKEINLGQQVLTPGQIITKGGVRMVFKGINKIDGTPFFEEVVSPERPSLTFTAQYRYQDQQGKQIEEEAEFNLDRSLAKWQAFYTKHKIDLPPDFEETMSDIWSRNEEAMKDEAEKLGFDNVLMIPAGFTPAALHTPMSAGYNATHQGDNFKVGGSFQGVKESNQARIILLHKKNARNLYNDPTTLPILKATLSKTAQELFDAGERLTLSDYLLYQRAYFEESGQHLDESGWTWLPGSTVPNPGGGLRFVYALWNPDDGQLVVYANVPAGSLSRLGCRLSRLFL